MNKKKSDSFRVLARQRWVAGAIITESIRRDDATENGISIRRFTATIRGLRNWKIYEGPTGPDVVNFVVNTVREIRDRIDAGDKTVLEEPNEFATSLPINTTTEVFYDG